jgi:hypothetical protein
MTCSVLGRTSPDLPEDLRSQRNMIRRQVHVQRVQFGKDLVQLFNDAPDLPRAVRLQGTIRTIWVSVAHASLCLPQINRRVTLLRLFPPMSIHCEAEGKTFLCLLFAPRDRRLEI